MTKTVQIKGFENYTVSTDGSVKSKFKTLKPIICKNGYCYVNLTNKGKRTQALVHRLVAEHFIPNTTNERTVNHKNGIKTDNSVENLEWCSYSENLTHRYRVLGQPGVGKGKTGIFCKNSKAVLQIKDGKTLNVFYSAAEAERKTGICKAHICECCRNIRKTAGNFCWSWKVQ